MDAAPRPTWTTRAAIALLVAGLALRAGAPLVMDVWEDGGEYVAMGHAWAEHGAFLLPSGESRAPTAAPGVPGHSHHYPPAFPFLLGLAYEAFGYGPAQTSVALALVSLAAVATAWWTTRDLYGTPVALPVAALVAVEPHLVWATGRGYSENLLVVFFTLTLWAILRSLRDERFIVAGGLFAGLAYLTRASLGPFFIVAGLGGLAWRVLHRGWRRTLSSRSYLAAAAIFGAIVLAWAARNVARFGWPHWQTSAYMPHAYAYALAHPAELAVGLGGKLAFFSLVLAAYVTPLRGALADSWRRWRDEDTSALMLAVGLVFVLAWLVTALLWPYEGFWLFFPEHHRYVVAALVPLAWLALRDDFTTPTVRRGWLALGLAFLVLSLAIVAYPQRDSEARAATWLAPHVETGDTVGIVGMSTYTVYPFLADTDARLVQRALADAPEFVLSRTEVEEEGYVLVGTFHQHAPLKRDRPAWLLARADVAQERGLPTGLDPWAW